MIFYVMTRNDLLVGITTENAYAFDLPDVSIHEFNETIPDLNTHVWDPTTEMFVLHGDHVTKLSFLNRLTLEERINIRASTNPIVIDVMNMLEVAEYISLTDPNTVNAVGYLSSIGLLTPSRVSEILS